MDTRSPQDSKSPTSEAHHSDSELPSSLTLSGDTTDQHERPTTDEKTEEQVKSERLYNEGIYKLNKEAIVRDPATDLPEKLLQAMLAISPFQKLMKKWKGENAKETAKFDFLNALKRNEWGSPVELLERIIENLNSSDAPQEVKSFFTIYKNYDLVRASQQKCETEAAAETESSEKSPGVIVALPEAHWTETSERERIHLKDTAFQLRAVVAKVITASEDFWRCEENVESLAGESNLNHLFLFYERVKDAGSENPKEAVCSIPEERKATMENVKYPPLKADTALKWECVGNTAALEAALRGLLTIKAFTASFEQVLFKPKKMQPFFSLLNSSYESLKRQSLQKEGLKQMMWLLKGGARLPHEYIIELLKICDESTPKKSGNQLQHVTKEIRKQFRTQRNNNCEVLHDIFSVLMAERNDWFCVPDKWTYSRLLSICLESGKSPHIFALETLLSKLLRPKFDSWCGIGLSYRPEFCYLGSALIIRLYEEDASRQQEAIIYVPRTLDMEKLGVTGTAKYNLRAIVYRKNRQQSDAFTVQEIDDSEETSQLLEKGVNAYLLFFEKGEVPKIRNKYGLRNLGNTCFMNAALNGLHSLHSFRTIEFKEAPHPLLLALTEFCENYTQREVSRKNLYKFKNAMKEFSDGRQHCANSYVFKLLMLLDTLLPTSPISPTTTFPQDIFGNKMRQYRKGKCEQLHDIFGTLAENLFICIKCSHTRRNFSYFRTVDVPIPYYAETFGEVIMFSPNNFYPGQFAKEYTGTEVSETEYRQEFLRRRQELPASTHPPKLSRTDLFQCFKYMLRASLMSSQSLMQCDDCGGETQHFKQSFFRQLSTAFVIHFQRFDERDGRKLNTPVDFPMNLNMSEYCVNDPRQYTLRAVVYHFGSLDSGHYTAWVNMEGRWFNVNDSYARETECEPPSENAYMLFYEDPAADSVKSYQSH